MNTTSAAPRERERAHDLVLFGASGFTGRLVAGYLARRLAGGLRLALAGRDRGKLEQVRAGLAAIAPGAAELPILLADSSDAAALGAIAGRTRVVCSTVGPYARHGAALVAACAEQGTDYCDLTAEVPFMRRMIDAHHQTARSTGARIVHSCGFDSIPSDLGVQLLQEEAIARFGRPLDEVRFVLLRAKGGLSGGTVASILGILEEAAGDPAVRRLLADPYALNPEGERAGPDGRDRLGVSVDPDLGVALGPFLMAAANTRVVRRSNALLGWRWGRGFRYSEAMAFGRGIAGRLRAAAFTAGVGAGLGLFTIGPLRRLLAPRVLPRPGEGPDEATREAGSFAVRFVGSGADAQGAAKALQAEVAGKADPGYAETAKMLGESALCLALDRAATRSEGGVLTPATAMGARLRERLVAAGMEFRIL